MTITDALAASTTQQASQVHPTSPERTMVITSLANGYRAQELVNNVEVQGTASTDIDAFDQVNTFAAECGYTGAWTTTPESEF